MSAPISGTYQYTQLIEAGLYEEALAFADNMAEELHQKEAEWLERANVARVALLKSPVRKKVKS